jgi:c-di-GMP-related signal transduction protein
MSINEAVDASAAAAAHAATRADEQEAPGAIARQAILDGQRAVFGYELFNRTRAADRHSPASDAELLFNVLTHADHAALLDKKLLFVNCTHNSLSGSHLELVQPERVVLEMPLLAGDPPEDIERCRGAMSEMAERGFRLAFGHQVLRPAYACWRPLASFIKLDMSSLKPEQVEEAVRLARQQPGAQLIAEKVETAAQFAQASALGVTLFQGFWFLRPVTIKSQTIRPAQAAIIQLINLVRREAPAAQIEEILKRDPSLSFNLLRLINSAGFGLSCEVTSFRHAIMILGLKKLYRWAALLLTTSRLGDAPPSIGTTAIVRGRLMELLAGELLPAEECDNAFLVGMFSLLDAMLGVTMDKALTTLSLPDSVTEVLLRGRGVFAPFLELALACERVDDESFARAANALQLTSHQVNLAHLQALAWAESMGQD